METSGERALYVVSDLLWGFRNGFTTWIILIVHIFGGWEDFPFYNAARSGNWYDFGFSLGAGSPRRFEGAKVATRRLFARRRLWAPAGRRRKRILGRPGGHEGSARVMRRCEPVAHA